MNTLKTLWRNESERWYSGTYPHLKGRNVKDADSDVQRAVRPLASALPVVDGMEQIERGRIRGRLRKLLDLLWDRGWHTNTECVAHAGHSFGGYLNRLRRHGWLIESRRVRGGLWEYRLTGKGPPLPPRLSAAQKKTAWMFVGVFGSRVTPTEFDGAVKELPDWLWRSLNE
jgi:hypothetical protein